jgi:hypothetical protein
MEGFSNTRRKFAIVVFAIVAFCSAIISYKSYKCVHVDQRVTQMAIGTSELIKPSLMSTRRPENQSNCDVECRRFQQALMPNQTKAAIYYLVQSERIAKLLMSLEALETHFNNHFHYPVIIFHEHDFTTDHQEQIRSASTSDLYFQGVYFTIPDFIQKPVPETFCGKKVGYRHMCRFQAKTLYEQPIVKHLDFIWRLDDDSFILSDINYDIFEFMSDHDIIYGYTIVTGDAPRCVTGLWNNAALYIQHRHLTTEFFNEWPRPSIYYNNFEVSAMKLWYSKEYQDYINMIDHTGGIYYNRWGDAPIKTIAVTMFVPRNKTHCFSDIRYRHQAKLTNKKKCQPN